MLYRPIPLPESLPTTAFAFRGYDVANLGRTPELLDHPAYGPVIESALREGSEAAEMTNVSKATARALTARSRRSRRQR